MKIIVDSRMREAEKKYLSCFGDLIQLLPQDSVYEEISGHPDIFFCKLNNVLFVSPNVNISNFENFTFNTDTHIQKKHDFDANNSSNLLKSKFENNIWIKQGREKVSAKYPQDVKYNICQVGNFVIHNFDFTDKEILKYINENNLKKINIKQGYSNCSISVISNNACITSDIRNF